MRRRQLAAATLLICELCLLVLNARPSAAAQEPTPQPVNPQPVPEGVLKVIDASPDRFNAPVPLRFSLQGAKFDRAVDDVWLTINGTRVTGSHLKMSAHILTTDVQLTDGSNFISLNAYDAIGRPLHYNETIWCGNWSLRVDVVDADGSPVADASMIAVTLGGYDTVRQQEITDRGTATFTNLPAQKVVIDVRASHGTMATAEAFGSAGVIRVDLQNPTTASDGTPGAESAHRR